MDIHPLIGIAASIAAGGFINYLRGGNLKSELKFLGIAGGISAWVAGVIFALLMGLITQDWVFALVLFAAYVGGESLGWTKWLYTIQGKQSQAEYNASEWAGKFEWGSDVGKLFFNEREDYHKYALVSMGARGVLWFTPIFVVFAVFGVCSILAAVVATLVLSVMFPLTYWCTNWINIGPKYWIARSEMLFGLVQGLVIGLVLFS